MMTLATIRSMLAWSTVINMGLLMAWFLMFFFAHDRSIVSQSLVCYAPGPV
jgi:hypothetical protein